MITAQIVSIKQATIDKPVHYTINLAITKKATTKKAGTKKALIMWEFIKKLVRYTVKKAGTKKALIKI